MNYRRWMKIAGTIGRQQMACLRPLSLRSNREFGFIAVGVGFHLALVLIRPSDAPQAELFAEFLFAWKIFVPAVLILSLMFAIWHREVIIRNLSSSEEEFIRTDPFLRWYGAGFVWSTMQALGAFFAASLYIFGMQNWIGCFLDDGFTGKAIRCTFSFRLSGSKLAIYDDFLVIGFFSFWIGYFVNMIYLRPKFAKKSAMVAPAAILFFLSTLVPSPVGAAETYQRIKVLRAADAKVFPLKRGAELKRCFQEIAVFPEAAGYWKSSLELQRRLALLYEEVIKNGVVIGDPKVGVLASLHEEIVDLGMKIKEFLPAEYSVPDRVRVVDWPISAVRPPETAVSSLKKSNPLKKSTPIIDATLKEWDGSRESGFSTEALENWMSKATFDTRARFAFEAFPLELAPEWRGMGVLRSVENGVVVRSVEEVSMADNCIIHLQEFREIAMVYGERMGGYDAMNVEKLRLGVALFVIDQASERMKGVREPEITSPRISEPSRVEPW